ncbi:uncharacterized protein [Spinacia oleracea]|uniref:ATP-dependent DNA helicase n=1 Tax=Spinacia oleracea TaxID=3562 RepID=A0ABM3QUB7_SPIOL|nr:uncharacterized protein LOC110786586 [Spinacia oleracea]
MANTRLKIGFDLFEMFPSVLPLQIHLLNLQTIQVMPHENLDEIILNDKRSRTQLTEFFRMNAATPNGTGYTYAEFPEHYKWEGKEWKKRSNKTVVVGRLTFVAPAEGERYFLRLLLMHVDSPRSFDHLRTVDGYKCATFQETALRLKLLEEDNAVDLCLAEACEVQMPTAFRQLFSTVLIFCQPSDPNALWLKYYDALSEDYRHQFPSSDSRSRELTVRSVEQSLEAMGKSFRDFGLQHLNDFQDEEFRRTKDIIDALDAPIPRDCIDARNTLNQAQQEAFDSIIDHVLKGKPGALFIDGPGGTGKTFLYNALYAEVRLMNKIVLPTATSGIAASNIPSGRIAHSRSTPGNFTTTAILTPLNEDVDDINATLIDKFPGESVMYRSFDTVLDDNSAIYPPEFIHTLCPGGMSPYKLVLKKNCPVLLLRNILPSSGLCNGTRNLSQTFLSAS